MIIIVDSGSTKADWKLVNQKNIQTICTAGFNPVYQQENEIYDELSKSFLHQQLNEQASQIFFYGTGCGEPKRKAVMFQALQKVFKRAQIEVEHDLLGAARATCGQTTGVACILGTGSNSCLFDGVNVIDNVTNLGYILGDEGSGTFLGKMLIRSYFYRELPAEIAQQFAALIPGGRGEILDNVYGADNPNVYLASFTKFLSQVKSHPFIQSMLKEAFGAFADRHVRKYDNHERIPIHFIGSVGYYFQDIIKIVLKERGMEAGKFILKPIDHLVAFHTSLPN